MKLSTQGPIKYRRLRSGGYELIGDWWVDCPQLLKGSAARIDGYAWLNAEGRLYIKAKYRWDGPSGPTIDTANFMRGSLAHDALYQMMRAGSLHPSWRQRADELLYQLCRLDGMGWFRGQRVYWGLRLAAGHAAKRQHEVEELELVAP